MQYWQRQVQSSARLKSCSGHGRTVPGRSTPTRRAKAVLTAGGPFRGQSPGFSRKRQPHR